MYQGYQPSSALQALLEVPLFTRRKFFLNYNCVFSVQVLYQFFNFNIGPQIIFIIWLG